MATAPDAPATTDTPPHRPDLSSLKIQRGPTGATRRRRRWPWVLGALLLLGAAAAALMPRATPVQAATVQTAWPSQQYSQLAASGYVVAQRRAAVSSKATGRLIELTVREGSVVKKGELIARLDASDVQAALAAGEAGVAQARAARQQAEAALAQTRVQQTNAEADLQRTEGLVAQGFISPQAVDAARTRARAAEAATAAAQSAIATAQAGIAQAQAQVKVQQVSRDNTEIRAPFDGVVLVKNANVGDLITPFSNASGTSGAVVTMADMDTLEVEADVSESSVAKVKPDQPVEITLDALPDRRLRGSVARIVPTVDRAKATVMIKLRFEQRDPRILPEMSAKVSFLSQALSDAEQKPVLAAPAQAVVQADGRRLVWRLAAGDVAEAVPVTVGRPLGELVELTSGAVKAGDRLVLNPPAGLKAGARLSVTAGTK
jgi:HlyD family secretion protein